MKTADSESRYTSQNVFLRRKKKYIYIYCWTASHNFIFFQCNLDFYKASKKSQSIVGGTDRNYEKLLRNFCTFEY